MNYNYNYNRLFSRTALNRCIECRNDEITSLLLNHENIGPSLNDPDSKGVTPLLQASKTNDIKSFKTIIEKLLKNNKDIDINHVINQKSIANETPFLLASKFDSVDVLKILIDKYDVDVNQTVLHFPV